MKGKYAFKLILYLLFYIIFTIDVLIHILKDKEKCQHLNMEVDVRISMPVYMNNKM